MIKSYTKLPVTVEAIQWNGKNLKEVTSFISGKPVDLSEYAAVFAWERYENIISDKGLTINTLEGDMKASIGDYIIKGVNGEFYPCKPDIFNKTYKESNSPNVQEFEEAYSLSETPLDRMRIEENDLDKKLIAIENLFKSDTFKKLDSISQAMLNVQYRMMCDYQQILNNRIDKINLGTIVNGYLDFGQAIEFLKAGCAVRRLGWNGKGLFVIKQIPTYIDSTVIPNMQSLPQSAKDLIMDSIQSLVYTSQGLIIDTKTGKADSWSPSISDVFAEDWELITY